MPARDNDWDFRETEAGRAERLSKRKPVKTAELDIPEDPMERIIRQDAWDAEHGRQMDAARIVREEWHRAVVEFTLRPGSPTETVIARILQRLAGTQ